MKKIIVFVLLSFLCFIFCTKNSTTEPEPVNHAPVIESMTAVPAVLNINMVGVVDSAVVTVIVTDVDDTSLTYEFNAVLGKLSSQNGGEITYTPPAEHGDYVVSCTVSDGKSSDVDSVAVQVLPPEPLFRIAFQTNRDGNSEIYIMNADGSNQTNLTNSSTGNWLPSISPNGDKIAFVQVSPDTGIADIYIMNVDGSNQTRLTYNKNFIDWYPSWSYDGSKIAFESRDPLSNSGGEIYIINSDGSNQTRLTNNSYDDTSPSLSPDGSKIAFKSYRDGNSDIYIINSDGTNQTRLTNNSAHEGLPSWSPDGSEIAFYSDRDGNSEIYVMNIDGSNQTRLTYNSAEDMFSPWSPEGSIIAFTSDRDGNDEIYIMNADGTNQIRLTNNSSLDSYPSCSKIIK